MKPDIRVLFAHHHLRITKPRLLIFTGLKATSVPISIADLTHQCPTIDRVSVYRTVELFLKLGIIESVSYGWKQRYELAAPFRPHHHHLFCTKCQGITEVHSQQLEAVIKALATEQEFEISTHTFEITGTCHTCQKLLGGVGRP
jgi:Fur family peroxide stress response transcriptional regulator